MFIYYHENDHGQNHLHSVFFRLDEGHCAAKIVYKPRWSKLVFQMLALKVLKGSYFCP